MVKAELPPRAPVLSRYKPPVSIENDSGLRLAAAKALKDITGGKFGGNQKKWQMWWRENKERIINQK